MSEQLSKDAYLRAIGDVHIAASRQQGNVGMVAHVMRPDVELGDDPQWGYCLAPIPLPAGMDPAEALTTMEVYEPSFGFCTSWAGMVLTAPAVVGDEDQGNAAVFGPATDDRPMGRVTIGMRPDGEAWSLVSLPDKGHRLVGLNQPVLRDSQLYQVLRQHCIRTQVIVDETMGKVAT